MKAVRLILMGALCSIPILIYKEALSGYFLGDDLDFLYYVAKWEDEGKLIPNLLKELFSPQDRGGFFYRPFAQFSFALDYTLWRTNSMGWHMTNLLLHIVNAMLIGKIVELVGAERNGRLPVFAGFAAAILFAVRPSSPEVAVWISGRFDGLALFGLLISILSYLRVNGEWKRGYLLALAGFFLPLEAKRPGSHYQAVSYRFISLERSN